MYTVSSVDRGDGRRRKNRRSATRRRTINLALRMKLYRRQTEERRPRSDVLPRTCDKIKLRQIDGRRTSSDFADEDRW